MVYSLLSGIQEMVRTKRRAQVLFPGAWGGGVLGVKMSSSHGLEYLYDGFDQSFSPVLSVDIIYPREIINSSC